MKGLRIVPAFLALIGLSYLGLLFVEANRQQVQITFGSYQSEPTALGLVVLTSVLIGMVIAGCLCTVEMLALYIQNKSLKRRLSAANQAQARATSRPENMPVAVSPIPMDKKPEGL